MVPLLFQRAGRLGKGERRDKLGARKNRGRPPPRTIFSPLLYIEPSSGTFAFSIIRFSVPPCQKTSHQGSLRVVLFFCLKHDKTDHEIVIGNNERRVDTVSAFCADATDDADLCSQHGQASEDDGLGIREV